MKLNHGPHSDVSKIIKCTECEYQTLNPILIKRHNRSKHLQERKYYCDICAYKSFYRHNVNLHIKSHKGTNARVKSINCTHCQTNTEHDTCHVIQHIKSIGPHSDVSKIITCTECEYQTLNPILIKKHNRSKYLQERKYYCDICAYKSFYRHNVNLHIKSHKGTNARVKSINCTQCQTNTEHDTY